MTSETNQDAPPADANPRGIAGFHHPFTPYEVQLQFMRTVYDVLDRGDGQVGILESPTGTGKSLSLICSALTWLRNHKRNKFEVSMNALREGMKDEPDWIVDHMLCQKRDDLAKRWEEREARLAKIRAKEKEGEERGSKRRRVEEAAPKSRIAEEDEFLLDEWTDGGEDRGNDPALLFSKETRALMEKVGLSASTRETEEDDQEEELKIFYTSRTHSQLSQFVSELRLPSFPGSVPTSLAKSRDIRGSPCSSPEEERVRHVPLSSRQRLCINPSVSRLGSLSAINDRCAELQQSKSAERCQFVPNSQNLSNTHRFRDTVLATLPDIEDTFRLGKSLQVCPYYASRTAIPGAEIITLPYPLLLQKSARDALGIKLEGNVVIVDEAHNIMDAVANVHAAEIRLGELRRARQMLGVYVRRFGKKLKGENRVMVTQVVRVVDSLSEWLDGAMRSKGESGIADPNLLLKTKGADQVNIYKLIQYIQVSKLAYKVESYADHVEERDTSGTREKSSSPVLHALVSFLAALTNLSTEGRVFYEKIARPSLDIKLSYLLLSPAHAFSTIATTARAVILAGGTMSPFDDYTTHLLPYLDPSKITTLSCGHVIPATSLCVWTLASTRPTTVNSATARSADNQDFEFSFQKRGDLSMMRRLGVALLNICSVVPDGVVVFFPSYGYLDEVVARWQARDPEGGPEVRTLWDRLQEKKAVFKETKGGSSEEILEQYSAAILVEDEARTGPGGESAPRSRGALLLSVVGGKMSEGINFSDRLGRCVVIVGLPYPNINSPEWKARIKYIESSTLSRLSGAGRPQDEATEAAKQASRVFYENVCMRAVNQSIGRAIRHRGDYAAIVLVDRRFSAQRIRGKLPGWIRGGMVAGSEDKGLQGLMGSLSGFFRGKEES